MIRAIGKYIPNIAIGRLDAVCEFAGLPVVDDAHTVTLRVVAGGDGWEMPLAKTASGYGLSPGVLLDYMGQAVQAYIRVDDGWEGWRSNAFYISIAPMPRLTVTPSMSPDAIDALFTEQETPIEEIEEPTSNEPTIEERLAAAEAAILDIILGGVRDV